MQKEGEIMDWKFWIGTVLGVGLIVVGIVLIFTGVGIPAALPLILVGLAVAGFTAFA